MCRNVCNFIVLSLGKLGILGECQPSPLPSDPPTESIFHPCTHFCQLMSLKSEDSRSGSKDADSAVYGPISACLSISHHDTFGYSFVMISCVLPVTVPGSIYSHFYHKNSIRCLIQIHQTDSLSCLHGQESADEHECSNTHGGRLSCLGSYLLRYVIVQFAPNVTDYQADPDLFDFISSCAFTAISITTLITTIIAWNCHAERLYNLVFHVHM